MLTATEAAADLAVLHPAQARTYDVATGTVETIKLEHERRADGSIVGLSSPGYQPGRRVVRIPLAQAAQIRRTKIRNREVRIADAAAAAQARQDARSAAWAAAKACMRETIAAGVPADVRRLVAESLVRNLRDA